MGKGHPRKIRNFLLYKEYQLRYAFQMMLVSATLTALLGWLVLHFNSEATRVLELRALDPADGTAQFLLAEFTHGGRILFGALIGFGLLLSVALALWQIVTTHKVAGPLYYIDYQVKRMRDGHLGTLHPLRKGDMLHEFFESFRGLHQSLRERAQEEAALFERLAAAADQAGQGEIASELRALRVKREEALK